MKKQILIDDIYPGKHQEVIRKIYQFSIGPGFLSESKFKSYIF